MRSDYNLLSLQDLPATNTYFDMLPKDVLWYIHGLTKPQDGHVVLRAPFISTAQGVELVSATTLQPRSALEGMYPTRPIYGPRYFVEKVKFLFIDGTQYAAVPIRKKIEGFTPKTIPNSQKRCSAVTLKNKRCKKKGTTNQLGDKFYCTSHQK